MQAAVFESADFDLTPESYDLLDEALLGRPPCYTAASRYEYFYQTRIDWSYTIDLDNEVFSINRGTHCRLREIPRYSAWKDFIATDGCYVPHDTLVNVVPDLRRNALEPSILGGCRFRVVMAKDIYHFDKQRLHSPLLVSALWKQFSRLHGVTIGNHLRSWKPEDFAFREYAHVISCLASRAPQRMRLFDFRRFRGCLRKGWLGPVEGEDPNSEDMDVISDFGVGCHPEGIEPGSAPETTVYWFEGVLIVLVAELCPGGDLTLFRDGMAKILETAQSECQSHFNAGLLSIEDVVLVRVFSAGYFEHSEAINLINCNTYNLPTSVICHIYNSDKVEGHQGSNEDRNIPGWAPTRFLHEIKREIPHSSRNPTSPQPAEPLREIAPRSPSWGLVALIHLFEATVLERL